MSLDIFIDSFQIVVVFKLTQFVNSFHPEHMLQHLLSCVEEYELESIAEVEGLGKNSEEFGLLEGDREPFFNNELVEDLVDVQIRHLRVLLLNGVCEELGERSDRDGDLTH